MLSVDYGFSTSVKRSGHAACWCAALGGIVQFGGWPPSVQLGDVVRHEGSGCPLYFMPATTLARHLRRADQRRSVGNLDRALATHRQRRLRRLLGSTTRVNCSEAALRETEGATSSTIRPLAEGAVLSCSSSSVQSVLSATTEDVSERGFVYDEGYVSEPEDEQNRSDDDDSSSSVSASQGSRNSGDRIAPTAAAGAAAVAVSEGRVEAQTMQPSDAATDAPASVVAPTITVELLRQVAEETGDRMMYGVDSGEGTAGNAVAAAASPNGGAASTAASHGRTSVSRSTHTGYAASTLQSLSKGGGGGQRQGVDREAPPVQTDTREVLGKHTVRPLRWQVLRPPVAPRTRHGHHLVSCGNRLYVIGGSYWAHGNALASTDMMYDVHKKVWQQVSSLFPPRFCAALAKSNTFPEHRWMPTSWSATSLAEAAGDVGVTTPTTTSDAAAPTTTTAAPAAELPQDQVWYYFGGLNYSRQLTNTLYRLWLPQETLEELPQYGAVPREQFKGLLVCDVQRECNPAERKRGEKSLGRLFYIDGLQDGRPMAPYLRVYSLATGVWVRVCPCPDLVRSQVSLLQYEPAQTASEGGAVDSRGGDREEVAPDASKPVVVPVTRLRRFEIVGGMPSRRGKQRRSRMCYSFDAVAQRFDYSHALPVPGLTAHCTVPVPDSSLNVRVEACREAQHARQATAADAILADGGTTAAAYCEALRVIRDVHGAWSLCCGGNEDWNDAEQNSLGDPVGWLYLFTPRLIPLSEVARVQMECMRIPMRVLAAEKDELLDELF